MEKKKPLKRRIKDRIPTTVIDGQTRRIIEMHYKEENCLLTGIFQKAGQMDKIDYRIGLLTDKAEYRNAL